jgi:hypothetical protein
MASTRNINTCGDYNIQQKSFRRNLDEVMYKYGANGAAYNPALPCGGSAPPSLMWRDALSGNPIEIESALFGINSTNLVTPQAPVYPQLKSLRSAKFFDRPEIVMPKPLVVPTDQRSFPVPE